MAKKSKAEKEALEHAHFQAKQAPAPDMPTFLDIADLTARGPESDVFKDYIDYSHRTGTYTYTRVRRVDIGLPEFVSPAMIVFDTQIPKIGYSFGVAVPVWNAATFSAAMVVHTGARVSHVEYVVTNLANNAQEIIRRPATTYRPNDWYWRLGAYNAPPEFEAWLIDEDTFRRLRGEIAERDYPHV